MQLFKDVCKLSFSWLSPLSPPLRGTLSLVHTLGERGIIAWYDYTVLGYRAGLGWGNRRQGPTHMQIL
jgi:hypothetical protein